MSISRETFNKLIKEFQFARLFNELGWDNFPKKREEREIDGYKFALEAAAEKRDFPVFVCSPISGTTCPPYNIRKKIDNLVTKDYFEHLIIYCDSTKTRQVWQLVIREHGRPVVMRERHFYSHQEPEQLFQTLKGLFFSLDDEDKIGIVDVMSRVREGFNTNAERVTKKFYDQFKKEHAAFREFIKGIGEVVDKDWYSSLMLNRLMFIYFIQKKGFLNDDRNYLGNKLTATQEKKGKDKFYSFYRNFLLVLFHKGLGSSSRTPELTKEIGKVPYLNGGLFDVHQIEINYENIEIADEAFEKIFKFFDQYEWHLDTRVTSSGKDINPDVIGYIFEKYINDRASMGAYYTKEDITDYISKNCIIPFIFDEVRRNYSKGLASNSAVWRLLHDSHDTYIYDAVKHGINNPLPDEIAAGLDTTKPNLIERRKLWNKPAPSGYALPTEIWREVVERRKRYKEIIGKIAAKEIHEINDFITYNLNIRQFAQDVIENTDDPELLKYFYKAISNITVLDPTCGSGAFLFAALNVLEPLYEACIQRMEGFREGHKGKYKDVFDELEKHPNRQYFIYKSIILRNLYGVDIMKEAVETAKLRLFLKLAATVEIDDKKPNFGLEPLPDIDFNIRAGNTLVGFAALKDVEKAVEGHLLNSTLLKKEIEDIKEQAETIKLAFERFKDSQLVTDSPSSSGAKQDLEARLKRLNDKLDEYQAQLYGKDTGNKDDLKHWKDTHQPFHWFAEFYEIVHEKGGFDVIIGNPPYVEYSKVKTLYKIRNYTTETCGNLYAYVIELGNGIIQQHGKCGMIVQLPIVCTDRMISVQQLLLRNNKFIWFSTYDDRPARLFDGLEHIRTTIFITCCGKNNKEIYSTNYMRWYSETREYLFNSICYNEVTNFIADGYIPKIGSSIAKNTRRLLNNYAISVMHFQNKERYCIYFHNSPQYWIRAMDFKPYFWNERNGEQLSVQVKSLCLYTMKDASVFAAMMNSSLFYWWFIIHSDCRHLNMREIDHYPSSLDKMNENIKDKISTLNAMLMNDLSKHSNRKECTYKTTGRVAYDEYFPRYSKPIIDEIDKALAKHYGFTDEELDFIINYDIKYRMGIEEDGTE
ncbi:Eco57I restriction-modification methylase domain-containing protein [Candidatus Magnetominusculus xianensis]|uniref:site-specific DNA-methyltransferase (adenine-specific) n=1 Tax=Candidatus Magnetominusculus xianensis TaxID=1748249 RepID=A0ABR5SJI9_9BACT|nr:DNA methyltransferase [Candidatus Magnetominusculus xianensis]KWT92173.1 hypothetical protein ASN18_0577 [Candidatus Magnetominusculus xianensis]MBF0404656.1 hypothetical protein [Nitrospirota bacterium]